MRKIMFVIGACLMLIGVPIPCAFAQTVSAYMCLSPESNAGVAKFILEKTGITLVQSFMSCGEVEAKVKAETPNYNVDVVVSASPLAFLAKKINGSSLTIHRVGKVSQRPFWTLREIFTPSEPIHMF